MKHLLSKGDVIGERYRVDAFLDQGGMQEVYRATDLSMDRQVALKIPKNNSATKRFARSAAMSARVTHPNVAKTFDYVETDNQQVLIEELIVGKDLRKQLESRYSVLDPHLAAHVLHHLSKGLAAVHREGVVHRDLKPSNIVVSVDADFSTIKITDFGIAKMAEAEIRENVHDQTFASQTVVGAIPYMAPEVIKNKKDVGPPADIWSVGALLYHLVTGEKPFGEGLEAVQRILGDEPIKRPASLHASGQFRHLAEELWSVLQLCMKQDAAERCTAAELVGKCSELCYSRAGRAFGVVNSFKPQSGRWGFIESGAFKQDTFFHEESFWGGSPKAGQPVSFARFPGSPRCRAHPVLLLKGT